MVFESLIHESTKDLEEEFKVLKKMTFIFGGNKIFCYYLMGATVGIFT